MILWLDHALFVLLAALFPIWAVTFGFRRLRRAAPEELPRVRLSVYRRAMAIQWTLTGIVAGLWLWTARDWGAVGLVPRLTPGLAGVAVGLAIVVVLMLRQRAEALASDEALARIRDRLRNLERMLPRSREELDAFYRLSVTAGVCEEVLYRGYLIWYLGHWLGLIPAAGVAAVLFGFGHSYQGWRGVAVTALVGVFLGAVYLLSGSLVAPMVIHALMDIHSGHLGHVAFLREREALQERGTAETGDGAPVHDPIV